MVTTATDQRDEEVWTAAAVAADPDGWAATLLPLARAVARRVTPPGVDRDDVTQECWLAILGVARWFRANRAAEPPLFQARRQAFRRGWAAVRRELGQRLTGVTPAEAAADRRPPAGDAIDAADWWDVHARRLDPKRRLAVRLRLGDGLSVAEVGAALAVGPARVHVLLAEGVVKLQEGTVTRIDNHTWESPAVRVEHRPDGTVWVMRVGCPPQRVEAGTAVEAVCVVTVNPRTHELSGVWDGVEPNLVRVGGPPA